MAASLSCLSGCRLPPRCLSDDEQEAWDSWDEAQADPDRADEWDELDLGYEDGEPEPEDGDFWLDQDQTDQGDEA